MVTNDAGFWDVPPMQTVLNRDSYPVVSTFCDVTDEAKLSKKVLDDSIYSKIVDSLPPEK